MSTRLEVAVGVVLDARGAVLLGQRVAGKAYAGWWEFPGGKIEAGEDAAAALARELDEELGLVVQASHPWLVREYSYPHAQVRLHFRRLFAAWGDWSGEPRGREGQAFVWQSLTTPLIEPLLPASLPVFPWLRLPASIPRWRPGLPLDADQPRALRDGAPLHLLEEPWRDDAGFEAGVMAAAARLRACGGGLLVSSSVPGHVARQAGGLILEPADLRRLDHRPTARWCGARCREAADVARADELGLDFVIAPELGFASALPVYLEAVDAGDPLIDGAVLGAAIRAGAHGMIVRAGA